MLTAAYFLFQYMAESHTSGSSRVPSAGSVSTSSAASSSLAPHASASSASTSAGVGGAGALAIAGGDGNSAGVTQGSAAPATYFASTLSGGPRDSLSVLICLNLALVYIRKGDIKSCEVGSLIFLFISISFGAINLDLIIYFFFSLS